MRVQCFYYWGLRWKRLFWPQRCSGLVNPGRWFARAVWVGTLRWGRLVINFSSGADWRQRRQLNHWGTTAICLFISASMVTVWQTTREALNHKSMGEKTIRIQPMTLGELSSDPPRARLPPPLPPPGGPSALPSWGAIQQELQHMTPSLVGRNLIYTWK